ncbi:MAG: VOC family protein, partial [Planctomycetia bacterium]|nr:VOC family protein [Planctomycetia bacterium]
MKIYEVFTRIFLNPEEIDRTVSFYENLFGQKCKLRFKYPEKGLELASVGSFLLISGSTNHLKPFRDTKVTLLVDSIDDLKEFLQEQGATILEEPKSVPTGRNMRVKHIDGLVVEYVE